MIEAEAVETTRANRAQRAFLAAHGSADLSARSLAVLAAVPHWWRRRAAAAGATDSHTLGIDDAMSFPTAPLDWDDLDGITAREDLFDASPEELADAYVVSLESSVRTADGRHYTPAPLAEALYQQAAGVLGRRPAGLIWDPACGAGMLLLPALRAWLAEQSGTQPEMVLAAVSSSIGGRDLDAAAVWLGNVLLAAELLPVWAKVPLPRRRPLPALLQVGDGLAPPPSPPTLTLMNPPYGRVRLSEGDREKWQHVVFGHANRYGLFMAAVSEQLAEGGVASALVPAGWLGGSYFQRLRAYLADTTPLISLVYVTDRSGVFSTGVLQETVLATFRKGKSPRATDCERLTMNGRVTHEVIGKGRLPKDADRPWLLPRQSDDLPIVKAAQKMTRRLADYGWSVSTGPLVWNRHKPQLSPKPSEISVKIIWAGDLEGGELHQDPSRDKLRYLHLREKDHRVLVLERPAVLVQRTTAPEQPRRLLAAALDSETLTRWGGRVSVENHVNVLTSAQPDGLLTPRLLSALLDSDAVDRLYRCLTGSVAVSAYELAALPLPGPQTLRAWAALPAEALPEAINSVYGLTL
ncbi:hypothetical protein ACFWAP_32775 [Streptomyces goshikiensis]|uniref:hypothetical protein n=1 Tax=Streptomyces goshikiensis TaxID=1942 RepID=UPI0036662307